MARKSKFKPRFAKQLIEGMRSNGMSIEECCVQWGVSTKTYYNWLEQHPKFKDAAETAETHYQAWFQKQYREGMTGEKKMNAGMMTFASKQILGWTDKTETHITNDQQIRILQIETIPSYKERLALTDQNVVDGEVVE